MIKYSLRTVFLLGTVIRLVLMPFIAHPFDVEAWYGYCLSVFQNGVDVQLFNSANFLWHIILIIVTYVYFPLSTFTGLTSLSVADIPVAMNPHYGIQWIPGPLFNMVVKLPMLFADIGITLVLYKLIKKQYGTSLSLKLSTLYYLNPVIIWISAGWGQYDSLPVLFTLLSIYFIINNNAPLSSISLLIGTFFKIYPIVLFVPFCLYLYYSKTKKLLFSFVIVFFIPFLIFLLSTKFTTILNIKTLLTSYLFPNSFYGIFGYGLTYWSWSMILPIDQIFWNSISLLIMMCLLGVIMINVLKKKRGKYIDFYNLIFLFISAFFLSGRYITEQRFVLLLPILLLNFNRSAISFKKITLLSTFAFLYTQKNFPYYLLPISTFNKSIIYPLFSIASPFIHIVSDAIVPNNYSAFILALFGTVFSISLFNLFSKSLNNIWLDV